MAIITGVYTGFEWFPESEIIDYFYNLFSAAAILQSRTFDGGTKITTFKKNEDLGDLARLEVKYKSPIICVKLGQMIEDEVEMEDNASSVSITAWAVIDSSIAARTKLIAEIESTRFQRNIKQVAYDENPESNLIIIESKSFMLDPYKNNDLHEVSYRSFLKVGYR